MRSVCATLAPALLFVLLALSTGAVAQSSAPAPGSDGAKPQADGIFVLTAASAAFVNETTIALAGLPTSTEWVKFPPQPAAGALSQERLTSDYLLSRDGLWAGRPQAALSGRYNGQQVHVLMQLDRPTYSPDTNTVTFQYSILTANNTDLPAVGGTVNDYAMLVLSGSTGARNTTLSAITPGSTMFYAVSIVVDIVGIQQYTTNVMARTEAGLVHVDLGANNFGYYYG